MAESLKQKTVSGVIWSSVERFSVAGLQFVIMIVMARMLTPEDYWLVAMLQIFIAVSQSLMDSGSDYGKVAFGKNPEKGC